MGEPKAFLLDEEALAVLVQKALLRFPLAAVEEVLLGLALAVGLRVGAGDKGPFVGGAFAVADEVEAFASGLVEGAGAAFFDVDAADELGEPHCWGGGGRLRGWSTTTA